MVAETNKVNFFYFWLKKLVKCCLLILKCEKILNSHQNYFTTNNKIGEIVISSIFIGTFKVYNIFFTGISLEFYDKSLNFIENNGFMVNCKNRFICIVLSEREMGGREDERVFFFFLYCVVKNLIMLFYNYVQNLML